MRVGVSWSDQFRKITRYIQTVCVVLLTPWTLSSEWLGNRARKIYSEFYHKLHTLWLHLRPIEIRLELGHDHDDVTWVDCYSETCLSHPSHHFCHLTDDVEFANFAHASKRVHEVFRFPVSLPVELFSSISKMSLEVTWNNPRDGYFIRRSSFKDEIIKKIQYFSLNTIILHY